MYIKKHNLQNLGNCLAYLFNMNKTIFFFLRNSIREWRTNELKEPILTLCFSSPLRIIVESEPRLTSLMPHICSYKYQNNVPGGPSDFLIMIHLTFSFKTFHECLMSMYLLGREDLCENSMENIFFI